ncbi:YcxB family protein [Streptomyces goshikiensis]|uniref:YcxB family protein n=1 Tax=Streptomyces goshikiensis TaxID=1942 RepID=UPI0036AE8AD4
MDMTDQAVELYYGARRGDVREVQRFALRRFPPARRALRAHFLAGASGAGATVLAGLVIPPHPARGLPPAALIGVAVAVGLLGSLVALWRGGRRMYAWASEYPEYRCVVSAAGTANHRPDGTSAVYGWDACAAWAETPNLFVFVYANGRDLGWIPKRAALVPEDLERLRGLLDRNLTRAG